ncbi:MAG TPA: hypothetical protein VHR15_00935 [Ktedonobacterales bacterium]|nr:hypothetical protein [Ktedonobacterales bacterium]
MKPPRQPPHRLVWTFCYLCVGLMALSALPGSIPRARVARVIPPASPVAQPDPPQHLDLTAAWGAAPIQRLPTQIDEGHRFVFGNAVTTDGEWLIGSIEPRLIFAATDESPVIALYNIATREILRLHTTRTPRSQLLGAATDGDWVVWSEATDVLRNADWTLYAYNTATKQISQLAQADRLNGEAIAGTMPYPVMDHGLVVWAQETAKFPADQPQSTVRALDITTGATTTLGVGIDPSISWPWVAWRNESGRDKVRPDVPVASDTLNVQNVQTQEIIRVHGSAESLTLDGRALAVCQARSLDIVNDFTKGLKASTTILSVDAPNHLQDVTMSARLIGWTQVGPAEVWDRLLRVFVELPIRNGQSATWVHGDTLVWLDPEPPEAQREDVDKNLYPTPDINVIDVTKLPAKLTPHTTLSPSPNPTPDSTPALTPSPGL